MAMKTTTESGLTLLSLASRQVWPHILAVTHLKPSTLVLLHSEDADESKRPAGRLQKFFDKNSQIVSRRRITTRLARIPHDDFSAVERRLDEIVKSLATHDHCALNFTGGNKLMATAAFRWATAHGVKSFYLERGNRLTWFEPSPNGLTTKSVPLNGSITNSLDAVELLRCQLVTSEVERDGEKLTLSRSGKCLSEAEFVKRIRNGSIDGLMDKEGHGGRGVKKGDHLELLTAAVLLKLGVPEVRRSLQLEVKTSSGVSSRQPHAEIDLLFNWNGRLWLVDCKNRISENDLMERLRKMLPRRLSRNATKLLGRIGDEMKISQTKVLKEDLIAINDMGGLLGRVVCVRRADLPEEARAYAERNRIEVVLRKDIYDGIRRLFYPRRPASAKSLAALEQAFAKPPSGRHAR